ncbi:MAG TPA: MASE3 domain-containing protein [Coriobacteriia bacterium]|nr:MASE3 domain-containing protein [Coriobacteriia bacterium]
MRELQTAGRLAPIRPRYALLVGLVLAAMFTWIASYNYPVFHTVVELFCMVVAGTIFVIAWNCRYLFERDYVLFLGIAMLGFTVLGVPHTLAYRGLGIFPGFDANLPTQIFIIQRYLLAASFLIAPIFFHRRVPTRLTLAALIVTVALALASTMWWQNFPDAFVEGVGLTPFKIISEYIIAAMFVIAAVPLWLNRRLLDRSVFLLIAGSLGAFVGSELMFTLYGDPFGTFNLLGHLSQVLAFSLLYLAMIRTALVRPYSMLFRELAGSEERYKQVAETLQAGMLKVPEHVEGLTIAHEYHAASETARIGGDFYDVFSLQDGNVGVVLGDVSGKGLEAATITAQAKSIIRAMAEIDPDPSFVLGHANNVLHKDLDEGLFVTVAYMLVDTRTGRLLQGSAGHPDPVICGGDRCVLEELPRNAPLGVVADEEYEYVGHELKPGECVVLYSDGISEARKAKAFFGDERVHDTLAELASCEPAELVHGLVSAAREFAGGRFTDDVAVLAVRLETPKSP